jgi:calcineurin-like phosphoesterase family protein
MNFISAKRIFEHTVLSGNGVSKKINNAILALIDRKNIERASELASNALHAERRVWVTSDLHLSHANIISYCDRPHHSVEDMNRKLLAQLRKAPENEILVFVGDMAMCGSHSDAVEMIRSIPSRFKILVVGNHDIERKSASCLYQDEPDLFTAIVPFLFWQGQKDSAVMVSHYPISPSAPFSRNELVLNYHGHLHDQGAVPSTDTVKYVNVCWDASHTLHVL